MPFLTIVTRCCKRPHMLTLNVQSVLAQTDQDLEQVFIVDYDQRGVPVANGSFALNKHRVEGDYVYILDDDTRLLDKGFIARLKTVAGDNPDVIMVKSSRPQFAPRILPKPFVWNCPERLALGSTNCLCYVVRREMWLDHIGAFGEPAAGDWWFLNRLRSRGATFAWIDLVVAETQQLGRGRLFETCGKDWFRQVAQKFEFEEVEPGDWRFRLWVRPIRVKVKATEREIKAILRGLVEQPQPLVDPGKVEIISVEHVYVPPKVTVVTRVPEPVLPVPAHSLLSRRRREND